MKKRLLTVALACLLSGGAAFAQKQWFNDKDLILTGAYYYPEHWNEKEWERDLKQMHEMGFEFTHFAEFAWAQIEPEEGKFDFAWLDRAVALAAKYKLKVIMCTSTATPPVWLTRKYPEVLIKHENGTKDDHGSRQHASFASPLYRQLAYKMIEKLAQHYGNDDRIVGWQIDNEPHVQQDYNEKAQQEFQNFLQKKYANRIDSLNNAWGTFFWSETYSDFRQIHIPQFAQWGMNPHQVLDYRRFAAKESADFLNEQCLLIKKYAKNQWVTSNYVPNYEEGHIGKSKDFDFDTYTRYMIYEGKGGVGKTGFRVGEPLRIALANDYFRPIKGTYGVMELQPGQVNWGSVNSQPLPGAVRLWLWSVFAGGSDFVCTYRYRQPLYGMEQYHYGIVGTDGVTPTPGGLEYAQFIKEVKEVRKKASARNVTPTDYQARRTAILYDHESAWDMNTQKQNRTWNTWGHIEKYYNTLKSFGAPVDVLDDDQKDISQYPVVIVPAHQLADPALVKKWSTYVEKGGHLILTCRTAQKDRFGRFPEAPFGHMLSGLTGNQIEFFDLLTPENAAQISFDGKQYAWNNWGEILKPAKGTEILATYTDQYYAGKPAATTRKLGKGTVTYIGVDSKDGKFEQDILRKLYASWNIPVMNLPWGVTLEYRNGLGIVLNYMDKPYDFTLPSDAKVLVGNTTIPTAGVLVFSLK